MKKTTFKNGDFREDLEPAFTYSFYLLNGTIDVDGETLVKDDFYVLKDAKYVTFKVENEGTLFFFYSPTDVSYRRFIERYLVKKSS